MARLVVDDAEPGRDFVTDEPSRLPFPTAHLWITVRRPSDGEDSDPAEYVIDGRKLRAAAAVMYQLKLLGWACEFDAASALDEGYVEWCCTKRFGSMDVACDEIAEVDGIRFYRSPGYEPELGGIVNNGEGDERLFEIKLEKAS